MECSSFSGRQWLYEEEDFEEYIVWAGSITQYGGVFELSLGSGGVGRFSLWMNCDSQKSCEEHKRAVQILIGELNRIWNAIDEAQRALPDRSDKEESKEDSD